MSDKERHAISGDQPVSEDGEQNVDKIREILFGGQMRDYQRRFDALETAVSSATDRLRSDLSNRIESLEQFMRRELELLGERLANERRERGQEREKMVSDVNDARTRVEQAIDRLDEQTAQEARALRASLQEKAAELAELIQHSRDDFNAMLTRQANSLEDRKVGREDLAALLSEVALRLNRELDLPAD